MQFSHQPLDVSNDTASMCLYLSTDPHSLTQTHRLQQLLTLCYQQIRFIYIASATRGGRKQEPVSINGSALQSSSIQSHRMYRRHVCDLTRSPSSLPCAKHSSSLVVFLLPPCSRGRHYLKVSTLQIGDRLKLSAFLPDPPFPNCIYTMRKDCKSCLGFVNMCLTCDWTSTSQNYLFFKVSCL